MKNTLAGIFRKHTAFAVLLGCLLWAENGSSQSGIATPGNSQSPRQAGVGAAPGAPASANAGRAPAIATSGLAQPVLQASPVAEDALYRMFFRFLGTIDQLADKLEKEGKLEAADAWRTHAQRGAGLNEQEGALMREIAFDCNKALETSNAELRTAVAGFRVKHPGSDPHEALLSPDLAQLRTDHQQIFASHLDQLKSQLGKSSFQKLDAYVRELFKASVTLTPAAQPGRPRSGPAVSRPPLTVGGAQ
jgi:hypothetical protein